MEETAKEKGRLATLLLTLVVLSLILLAAHFLRAGIIALSVVVLCLPFLLLIRRPWVAKTIQVALLLGTLEWLRTLLQLAGERIQMGQPVLRLVVILATVAVVTLLSAFTFRTATLKKMYGLTNG
jgi:hypothetical protein